MIYTVTLNPAIDKTVVIENLKPGAVNRVKSVTEDAGGKGVNVSKCLKSLGAASVAALILAGETGRQLEAMLQTLDIPTLPVWTEGSTRTNLKIIDPVKKENTDINEPGPVVTDVLLEQMKRSIGGKILPGDIVILSGSLPAGVDAGLYGAWVRYFKGLGAKVFLDADGEPMRLGIQAAPYMIKPNDLELARLLGKEHLSREEMLEAGNSLLAMGIGEIVISLGEDGALFLDKDGCSYAEGLAVPVQSTVGAGDSMVAAVAFATAEKRSQEEKIRLAVAMGSASVMLPGSGAPEASLVWELAKQVRITKY